MMVSVPRVINKCPNCGEPVSPFAAVAYAQLWGGLFLGL
jgi:hypothetical protein